MFAAAIIYSAPKLECSIYSTCKRISQKLLRNVIKFLNLIYEGLGVPKFKIIRENMEELVIKGPTGNQDIRTVNSYPSKVLLRIPLSSRAPDAAPWPCVRPRPPSASGRPPSWRPWPARTACRTSCA